MYFEADAV